MAAGPRYNAGRAANPRNCKKGAGKRCRPGCGQRNCPASGTGGGSTRAGQRRSRRCGVPDCAKMRVRPSGRAKPSVAGAANAAGDRKANRGDGLPGAATPNTAVLPFWVKGRYPASSAQCKALNTRSRAFWRRKTSAGVVFWLVLLRNRFAAAARFVIIGSLVKQKQGLHRRGRGLKG